MLLLDRLFILTDLNLGELMSNYFKNILLFLLAGFLVSCGNGLHFDLGLGDGSENTSVPIVSGIKAFYGQTAFDSGSTAFGTTSDDMCMATVTDSSGNIYCAGKSTGNIEPSEAAESNGDAFVMKFNTDGDLLWVTQFSTSKAAVTSNSGEDFCKDIALDSAGNIYCGGGTRGNLGETNGGGLNFSDAFIAKLDTNGNILWISQFGSDTAAGPIINDASSDEFCAGIAVGSSGNVYCAGSTYGSLGEANGGQRDIFFAQVNSSGTLQWLTQFGTTTSATLSNGVAQEDFCNDLAIDSSENLYCGGSTAGDFAETNLDTGNSNDVLIVKVDSSGTPLWARQLGNSTGGGDNSGHDHCRSITVSSNGSSIFCVGETNSAVGEANAGSLDALVVKLNGSGSLQWISQLGAVAQVTLGNDLSVDENCGYDSSSSSIAQVDTNGDLYFTCFSGGSVAETNGGFYDVAVFKMDGSDGSVDWIKQLGSSYAGTDGMELPLSLAIDNDSSLVISGTLIFMGGGFLGGTDLGSAGGTYNPFIIRMGLDGSFEI